MVVVDDDSTDGTWQWARQKGATDARLRCLRRVGRRGLVGVCIEGALCSSAPVIAVTDGDLQHDGTILAAMWRLVAEREADVVIGTRRIRGGVDGAMSARRRWISDVGAALSGIVLKRAVADPMSGFFMARRDLIVSNVANPPSAKLAEGRRSGPLEASSYVDTSAYSYVGGAATL